MKLTLKDLERLALEHGSVPEAVMVKWRQQEAKQQLRGCGVVISCDEYSGLERCGDYGLCSACAEVSR